MKDKGATVGVFKSSRYPTLGDGESVHIYPTVRESSAEVDLEESDEEGGEDQPGKVCYVCMVVEEEHKEDAPSFV